MDQLRPSKARAQSGQPGPFPSIAAGSDQIYGFARAGPEASGQTMVSLDQSEPAQPVRAGHGQDQARKGKGRIAPYSLQGQGPPVRARARSWPD